MLWIFYSSFPAPPLFKYLFIRLRHQKLEACHSALLIFYRILHLFRIIFSNKKNMLLQKNLPLVKFYVFWLVVYCRIFVISCSHLQPDLCNFHNTIKKKAYSFCRCTFTICSSSLSSVFCSKQMSVRTAAVKAPQYTDLAS